MNLLDVKHKIYYLNLHKLAKHEVTMKGKILHTTTLRVHWNLSRKQIKVSRPKKKKKKKVSRP